MARNFTAVVSTTTLVYGNGDRVELPIQICGSVDTAARLGVAAGADRAEYRYFNKYDAGEDGSGYHTIDACDRWTGGDY